MNSESQDMYTGIFPVIPTLFDSQGDLDLAAQKRVIEFVFASNIQGLVFPGVASESPYLSDAERTTLLTQLVREVDSRLPIIGGASAPTAEEASRNAETLRQHGIETAMIMAPAQLGEHAEAHIAFFRAIAQNVPDLRIMVQNAPSPTGAGLNAEELIALIQAVPSIRYVKEERLPSGPTITHLKENAPQNLLGIFGGGGARHVIDELDRGADGAMPAAELADLHAAIFKAHQQKKGALARSLYCQSLPLLTLQAIYRMRLTKQVLRKRGVENSGEVRAALPEIDPSTSALIDTLVDDLRDYSLQSESFEWTQLD